MYATSISERSKKPNSRHIIIDSLKSRRHFYGHHPHLDVCSANSSPGRSQARYSVAPLLTLRPNLALGSNFQGLFLFFSDANFEGRPFVVAPLPLCFLCLFFHLRDFRFHGFISLPFSLICEFTMTQLSSESQDDRANTELNSTHSTQIK